VSYFVIFLAIPGGKAELLEYLSFRSYFMRVRTAEPALP
jgi:hypothetical protein